MRTWVFRIIVVIAAIAIIPLLVNGTATLVSHGVNGVSRIVHQTIVAPFSMSGSMRMEALIRLCLYLVAVLLVAKFVFARRG